MAQVRMAQMEILLACLGATVMAALSTAAVVPEINESECKDLWLTAPPNQSLNINRAQIHYSDDFFSG